MIRPSRRLVVFGAVLAIAVACSSGTSTAPERAPNTITPEAGPLFEESSDTTCRGGYSVTNGKAC